MQISAFDCLYFLEKDIDNFEEAIVYHELADSITNAMEELNSAYTNIPKTSIPYIFSLHQFLFHKQLKNNVPLPI